LLCIFGLTACSDGGNVAKIIEADVFVLDHSTSSTVWDSAQTRLVESVQNPWGTNIVQGEYIPSGELKVARSIHIIVVTDNTADRDPIEILSDESVDDVWSTFMTFTTNSVRAQELYDDFMADKNSFWSDVADEYLSEEKLAEPFQISSCESDLESNLDESKYADPLHLLDSETRNTAADVASTFCGFIDDVRGAFAELEIYKREISSDCADNSKCSDLPGAISTAIDIFDDAESDEIRSEALSNRLGYSKHYSGCVYFASDMISAATSLTQGYLQLNTLIRSSGLNDAAEMSTKAKEDLLDTTPKLSFEINVYMPSIGHSKSNLPVTDKQQSYLEDYWTNFFDESGFNHVETGSSSTACTGDEWSRQ
jgi:hypothetical protein